MSKAKPVHHGGKVGEAAKKLATPSTPKSEKTKAAETLKKHQDEKH